MYLRCSAEFPYQPHSPGLFNFARITSAGVSITIPIAATSVARDIDAHLIGALLGQEVILVLSVGWPVIVGKLDGLAPVVPAEPP